MASTSCWGRNYLTKWWKWMHAYQVVEAFVGVSITKVNSPTYTTSWTLHQSSGVTQHHGGHLLWYQRFQGKRHFNLLWQWGQCISATNRKIIRQFYATMCTRDMVLCSNIGFCCTHEAQTRGANDLAWCAQQGTMVTTLQGQLCSVSHSAPPRGVTE